MTTLRRTLFAIACLTAATLLAGGCAAGGAGDAAVHLRPLTGDRAPVIQHFGQAYATRNADGGNDIVLVDRSHPAVTHYMHVKVLWKPVPGLKPDQPSATNAAIDWYVVSRDPEHRGVLRYTGAGFVLVDVGGDRMDVQVQNASVKPQSRQGELSDPVGRSVLNARFTARLDAGRVESARAELAAALAGPESAQAVTDPAPPGR